MLANLRHRLGLYTQREVIDAVDAVRDREDCRACSTDYACGLEDGSVSVVFELGIATTGEPRQNNPYPEPGWATDQS